MSRQGRMPSPDGEPPQVLDDAVRVADRLAVDDRQRDRALARERADLGALVAPPRHADGVVLDAVAPQLALDAPARAEPVRGCAAAVERGHQGLSLAARPPACRAKVPATRSGSGCLVPGATSRPGSRSRYHAIVASNVSSWWAGFQPSSRLAFVERNAHHSEAVRASTVVIGG